MYQFFHGHPQKTFQEWGGVTMETNNYNKFLFNYYFCKLTFGIPLKYKYYILMKIIIVWKA